MFDMSIYIYIHIHIGQKNFSEFEKIDRKTYRSMSFGICRKVKAVFFLSSGLQQYFILNLTNSYNHLIELTRLLFYTEGHFTQEHIKKPITDGILKKKQPQLCIKPKQKTKQKISVTVQCLVWCWSSVWQHPVEPDKYTEVQSKCIELSYYS